MLGSLAIPTFIINLERDANRRAAILQQSKRLSDFDLRIVPGIYGRLLSDNACTLLAQDANWAQFKGTIGCFMSHVKAWEEVAQVTAPFCIVLEDDVDTSGLDSLRTIGIPSDAEIIFLNDRLSPCLSEPIIPMALPIWHALKHLEEFHGGPGGDGYLLTPRAAVKMLNACLTEKYYGHVDGRLLRYATSEEDLAKLPNGSWIESIIRRHHHPSLPPTLGLLCGYCLSQPLVRHRGIPSSREEGDNNKL